MKRSGTIGLMLGLGALAVACLFFVAKPAGWASTTPRMHDLFRWLGLGLPVPEHPGFIGPTLVFLNLPLWQAASALGLLLVAVALVFGRKAAQPG